NRGSKIRLNQVRDAFKLKLRTKLFELTEKLKGCKKDPAPCKSFLKPDLLNKLNQQAFRKCPLFTMILQPPSSGAQARLAPLVHALVDEALLPVVLVEFPKGKFWNDLKRNPKKYRNLRIAQPN